MVIKKRGVFFTIDAVLAASIIVMVIVLTSSYYVKETKTKNIDYMASDLVRVLTNIKVNEINNNYINDLVAGGNITRANNTILEQIGEFWSENEIDQASKFARNITEALIPNQFGVGIWVNEELIYSKNKPITRGLVSSKKLISGIAKERPIEGFTSRAFLSKITSKTNTKYYPFDVIAPCYRGWSSANADQISIEYTIELPADADVTNATWIIVPAISGTSVNAYINENLVFSGIPDEGSIINAQGNFTSGTNKVRYTQSYANCPGDDGTTHVILTYKTAQMQTISSKTEFPLAVVYADGRINDYEKPIFTPNVDISEMNISLNVKASSVDLDFRLNGMEFNIGSKDVINNHVGWSDDEIKNNLSANGLSYSDLTDTYFYFVFDFLPENNNVTIFENSGVNIEGNLGMELPFGSIDISQTIDVASQNDPTGWSWCSDSYHDVDWTFNVPSNSTHLYSDWLIGWCWANDADQIAKANGIDLYRHIEGNPGSDPFIEAFARFGYTKDVVSGSIVAGQNTFSLQFGSDYSTKPSISYGENVFFIPNSVSYSSVLEEAEGCTWAVQIYDGSKKTIKVPKGYSGSNNCIYNTTNIAYNNKDSLQVVALRIFELLDFDDNGNVDLLVSDDDLEIETIVISKVPSLWGPAIVEIRVWE